MVLGRVERQRDLIFWYMRHWDVSCSKCALKRYFQIIFSKDNLKLCSHNIFWYMRHWDVPCSKLWPPKPLALLHFCEPSERHLMWVLKCLSIASEKCWNHSLEFSRFDGKYEVLEIIQCMNISLRSLKLDEV